VAPQLGQQVAWGWAMAYVAPLFGMLLAGGMLWWAGRPRRVRVALA